jgi:hypothetical protein
MPNKYMHTLDGAPARYVEGDQIYFLRDGMRFDDVVVDSLATIKKQQRLHKQRRKGLPIQRVLGYVRFKA